MTPSELDQLADYAEGLLDGTPDGEAVAARIATDQEWADAYRQLSTVLPDLSADLAALPTVPMPTHVAAALDRALAAERPVRAESDEVPAASSVASEPPADLDRLRTEKTARDRAARRWRVAGGWVAAAALVGVLCTGLGQLVTSSSGDDAGDTAASSANEDAGPEVLSAPAAPPNVRVSGFSYSTAGLGPQARAQLGAAESVASRSADSAPSPTARATAAADAVPPALQRLASPTELRNCLVALSIAGEPLAVDFATLDGTPAIVVVAADADPARLDVVAAGPECGVGGRSDERARASVAR